MKSIATLGSLLLLTTYVSMWQQNLAVGVYGKPISQHTRNCAFVDAKGRVFMRNMPANSGLFGLKGCPFYISL